MNEIYGDSQTIVTSRGKAKLDAAGLKTITASAPFDLPRRELPVVIDAQFGAISVKPKGTSWVGSGDRAPKS